MDIQPEFMVNVKAIIGKKIIWSVSKQEGVNSDEFKLAGLHEKQEAETLEFWEASRYLPRDTGKRRETYIDMTKRNTFRMHTEF
jgi:hypothetical protein